VASKNRPGHYWSIDEGVEGYLMPEAELFRAVTPGFWGQDSVTFESVSRPGHYLLHRGGEIFVEAGDVNSESFRRECSWLARKDIFFSGYTSFESVHRPGFFIR
jgi:hypothetical protein